MCFDMYWTFWWHLLVIFFLSLNSLFSPATALLVLIMQKTRANFVSTHIMLGFARFWWRSEWFTQAFLLTMRASGRQELESGLVSYKEVPKRVHILFKFAAYRNEKWLCNSLGPFVYLYGPLLVLLLLNFLFFFATLIKICHTQKELSRILRVGNTTQNKYENHRKYAVFFLWDALMDLSWHSFLFADFSCTWNYSRWWADCG